MTPFRAATVVGFSAAAIALVTAGSGLAIAWAPIPASSSCLLFSCVGEALNNALGIPGSFFGAFAAVGITLTVVSLGLSGPASGFLGVGPDTSSGSYPGLTTYLPGVSAVPDKGDDIHVPGLGNTTVKDVYYDADSYGPDGNPSVVVIETHHGTIRVETTISGQ
jgi:hypothetical protein